MYRRSPVRSSHRSFVCCWRACPVTGTCSPLEHMTPYERTLWLQVIGLLLLAAPFVYFWLLIVREAAK